MEETKDIASTDSAEMAPLRKELRLLHSIFSVLGQATIRAQECKMAGEVLDYVQAKIDVLEEAVQHQEALESEAANTQQAAEAVLDAMRAAPDATPVEAP